MKNKKMILIAVALVACIAVMLGIFLATRPETVAGGKTITVTVVHKDGLSGHSRLSGPVLLRFYVEWS